MNEQVEWLKAQVEAYYSDVTHGVTEVVLDHFVEYIEEKFALKSFWDR